MHGHEHCPKHAHPDSPKLNEGTHNLPAPNEADTFTVVAASDVTGAWIQRGDSTYGARKYSLGLIAQRYCSYVAVYPSYGVPPILAVGLQDVGEPEIQVVPPGRKFPDVVTVPLSQFLAAVDWDSLPVKAE